MRCCARWVHEVAAVQGSVEVNGRRAGTGDGVALEDEANLTITSREDSSEILLFDLPSR